MGRSEDAAKGAAGGALAGGTVGSVFPGVGTLVGAGVGAGLGGLAGFFGGGKSPDEKAQDALKKREKDIEALIKMLQDQANGKDSITGRQLQQALGQSLAQQSSLAASARPGQEAYARRLAMQNQGNIASGIAGQAAMSRLQEQFAARQALAQLILQARQQDLSAVTGVPHEPSLGQQILSGGIGAATARLGAG